MIFRGSAVASLLLCALSGAAVATELETRGAEKSSSVEMVAAAWYAGWHASDFTLDDVSWEKYTLMTYAFASVSFDPF